MMMEGRGGPVGMFGERKSVRLSNPSSGLSLRVRSRPGGPCDIQATLRAQAVGKRCPYIYLVLWRRQMVRPTKTRPVTTPTNAIA
jgi:hypothetical protein